MSVFCFGVSDGSSLSIYFPTTSVSKLTKSKFSCVLCNLILSLTTQPATVRKNTGLREQFALGGPFVQPASSACFRRFFSAAISAISRANFSLHAASVWTETLVPFVSRSLSGSREAGTLQFPEKPLVQGLHVVVHTCRLPCSATQHTTETENSQGSGAPGRGLRFLPGD